MRIAFLASQFLDPDDTKSWSGLPFFMRQALEDAGVETVTLRPEETGGSRRWLNFLYWRWLRHKRYLRYCDPRMLRSYAQQCERQLAALSVDAVFSPSTWPLAYLETELPMVFWTDACFAGILGFYESFAEVAPPSIDAGHAVERRALHRCARAIYSSEWAAESARRYYDIDPAKISVVPFGGNFQEPPTLAEATALVGRREPTPCRLLLVGVDWKRKGADIAVETVGALNAAGVPSHLTIVGCRPPHGHPPLPDSVEVIPFIGKESAAERRRLREIYERSHFFIMPSRAEAFGIVYAEASAFGVPCLATRVGGLPSVIIDNVNGQLFSLEARGPEYAAYIRRVFADPAGYRELALSAAREGSTRLSWKVSGRRLAAILAELVPPHPSGDTPVPFPTSAAVNA
ncbi:MAG TPA: glycosyltransferase family 4 protein [Opitutaceae bacterium]|nr:glycosyltransferase family 4 protein [Opitutaceae bacterium]